MTDDCFLSLGEAAQLALMRAQWKMLLRQRKARLAASVGAERQEFFRSGEAAMTQAVLSPHLEDRNGGTEGGTSEGPFRLTGQRFDSPAPASEYGVADHQFGSMENGQRFPGANNAGAQGS